MKSIIASLLFLSRSSFGSGWDYETMPEWSHHYPMCGEPDESPINIQSDDVIYDSSVCTSTFNWTIDWSVHTFKIINNGHSVVLKPLQKTTAIDADDADVLGDDDTAYSYLSLNENTMARLPNYFLPEGSPHSEFCLDSFHFHWGNINTEGSEHLVDDIQYPLEVHFVHYSCEHASLGTCLGQFPDGDAVDAGKSAGDDVHQLAVVGILFEVTDYDNPLFDKILSEETLENIQFPKGIMSDVASEEIVNDVYLQNIIPDEIFTDGYFAYKGSLTTPPCTNIVRWHVMNAKSYIGKTQIARFRELMYTSNQTMAPNYRDPQVNINDVYACFEKEVIPDIVTAAERTERAIVWVYAVVILLLMIGMGVFCIMRSKKEKILSASNENHFEKRERLASKSSIGGRASIGGLHEPSNHNMSRQSSYAAASSHGSLHRQSSHH